MNKEELKQKAENYSNRLYIEPITRHDIRQAYLAGATETTKELQEEITTLKHNKKTVAHLSSCISDVQEKKIAELEAQIEKMKCCGNCQKLRGRFDSKTNINILYCSDSDMKQIEVGFQMCCCKWEIKEK